jgi:Mrp family chromosome partitioning ATPase
MSKIYEALQLEQNNQRKAYLQTEIHPVKPTYNDAIVWRNGNPEIEEEFINLYYTVHSLLGQKSGKVVQFISSMEGDGTSTISEQFGRVSTSGLGKSVLLIKTDGNGHASHLSGMEESDAHLERLGDGASAEEMFSHHGEPCFVVWSLTNPVSAQTIRSPERFETVLSKLRDHFDLILVDLPALSSSPLGLAVCALADGVIIVIEAEKTKSISAEKAKLRIQRAGGNILGVVFNKHRSHIPAGIAQF